VDLFLSPLLEVVVLLWVEERDVCVLLLWLVEDLLLDVADLLLESDEREGSVVLFFVVLLLLLGFLEE
jgi:hypothetical protein